MSKLKKLLRETYNIQPERKYSFLSSLRHNPVWRKLHPISTLSIVSHSGMLAISTLTLTVITAGAVIISHNFNQNTPDEPIIPDITPIVTVTSCVPEVTAVHSTELLVQSTGLSTVQNTELKKTLASNVTTVKTTVSDVQQTELSFDLENSSATTMTTVTETAIETTVQTSVYYSHLFRHDYTLADIAQDDTLLYGYPDNDVANEMFQSYNSGYIEPSIGFSQPPVVEGEIISIEYTSYNSLPLTICSVQVSQVFDFYGENVINTGDIVKIATYGGYMPVNQFIALNPDSTLFSDWSDEQIQSTILFEDGGNQLPPKVGDNYLFILDKEKQEVNSEKLYFMLSWCDIFRFYRNGDDYICSNSATNGKITYNRLKEVTDDKVYFTSPDGRQIMVKDDTDLLTGLQRYYSVDSDGHVEYLGETTTNDLFFPYNSEDDFELSWTEEGVEFPYCYDRKNNIFKKIYFTVK